MIAVLGGVLTAVLVLVTVGSLLAAGRFADWPSARAIGDAEDRRALEADRGPQDGGDGTQRGPGRDLSRTAQRGQGPAVSGISLGWRDDALGNLARLTTMPTKRRDLVELRTEAAASLGEFDVIEVARFEGLRGTAWSLDFSPDSRALATATVDGDLHLWDVARRQHSWQVVDPAGGMSDTGWPLLGAPNIRVRFLPDGGLVRTSFRHRVEFLDPAGRPSARRPIDGGTAQAVGLEIDRRVAGSQSDGMTGGSTSTMPPPGHCGGPSPAIQGSWR